VEIDDRKRGDCGKKEPTRSNGRIGGEEVDFAYGCCRRLPQMRDPKGRRRTREYHHVVAMKRDFRYDVKKSRSQEVERFEDRS
jgi:hypothetical protein